MEISSSFKEFPISSFFTGSLSPAGAIALAALRRLVKLGRIKRDEKVVLVASGFGFRDVGDADKLIDRSVTVDMKALESVVAKS